MVCPAKNFNPIAEVKKPSLRLQSAREGIAALLNLLLLSLLVSLLIDRRLIGAAALEEQCGAEEKQQGYFHRSETSALLCPCQDDRLEMKAMNRFSPNERNSGIFGAADECFSASVPSAPVLLPFALLLLFHVALQLAERSELEREGNAAGLKVRPRRLRYGSTGLRSG